MVEPDIPDSERWKTARGKSHYPFVRSRGGVSLFDFRGFDEDEYGRKYPMSNWHSFVPTTHKSSDAIWIEIDSDTVSDRFISGVDLAQKWKESGELCRTIMPVIEAAVIGDISTESFARILRYSAASDTFIGMEKVAKGTERIVSQAVYERKN